MNREEAIKYGTEWLKDEYLDARDGAFIEIALEALKQEPKTGHWIKQTLYVKPFGEDTVLCDQCAFMTDKDSTYNYCPNCGAKMVEPQERSGKE